MSVTQLLAATRSQNKEERVTAEATIDQYAQQAPGEFLPALLQVAADPQAGVADSQSALLALKSCIQNYWSPGFEQFTGPPFSHETRTTLRHGLPELLANATESKIRNACALVIARIGHLEYPDLWPDLVEKTLQMLSADTNSVTVLGGLALFKELLLETFREEDFTAFGDAIMGRLLELARPDKSSANSHARQILAIQCFHECITFLLMGDDDQLPQLDQTARKWIPQWIKMLCLDVEQDPDITELVNEVVGALREVDSAFESVLEPCLPEVFQVCSGILEKYDDILDDELRSNYSFLLVLVLQHNRVRSSCIDGSAESVERFASLLVKLSTLSNDTIELWLDDYNEFVTAELELNSGDSFPRINAAVLVAKSGQPALLSCLLHLLKNTPVSDVDVQEALLYLISNILSQVEVNTLLATVNTSNIQAFLTILEFSEAELQQVSGGSMVNPSVLDLLTARKMVTAVTVAKYCSATLPEDIRTRLAMHGSVFMEKGVIYSAHPVVRAGMLQDITLGAPMAKSALKPFQSDALRIIAGLIDSADEDTPTFLAESLGIVLKLDFTVVEHHNECIAILFQLAAKDASDIELNAQILDVVGELLDEVSSRSVVDSLLRPVLTCIRNQASTNYAFDGDLYFSLELVTSVLSHEDVEFSSDEREQMLTSFYEVITTTDDSQILQVASFTYAALVQNIGDSSVISPATAQKVLRVAARLLSPDLSDSAALASGKLVSAIIDKFGDSLEDILRELIEASAKRLSTAKNALLVETLVMVFCELALKNPRALVDILAQCGMLESVMKQWVPAFEVIIGDENIRKNIRALQLLFELNDTRLNELMLPDEPIKKSGEVLTRRKARDLKFTMVPLPIKILKLLVRELSQAPAQGVPQLKSDNEDNDDEWDDDVVMTANGDIFDFQAYNLILNWFKQLAQRPGMIEMFGKLNTQERNVLLEATK